VVVLLLLIDCELLLFIFCFQCFTSNMQLTPMYCGQNITHSTFVSSINENNGVHVSSLLHGIIPHHGSSNGDYIGFGLKAFASLEGYCARFCKNIDVVESHKQLDSIKKTRNEGKYNSKK